MCAFGLRHLSKNFDISALPAPKTIPFGPPGGSRGGSLRAKGLKVPRPWSRDRFHGLKVPRPWSQDRSQGLKFPRPWSWDRSQEVPRPWSWDWSLVLGLGRAPRPEGPKALVSGPVPGLGGPRGPMGAHGKYNCGTEI